MMKIKITMALLIIAIISTSSFAQVSLNVTRPLSAQDKLEVENILKSFDADSYSLDVKTDGGTLERGRAKGLTSVRQTTTLKPAPAKGGIIPISDAAKTSTNINIFKTAAAASNTNINIFSSSAAKTNTNINIFKPANFNAAQLSQMDKLHQILSKYN